MKTQTRTKICILPKLNDCNGNLKKQWFIYFSYRNPADNKMTRFRVYDGFTQNFTKKAKYAHAEELIQEYDGRLKSGWNPFLDDTKEVYEDTLSYATVARIYKGARSGNKTFNYYSNLFLPEVKGLAYMTYKINIENYPVIKDHFLQFGKIRLEQNGEIGNRKKTNNKWFETQDSIVYWQYFEKPKIVWGEISDKPKFAYDDSNFYAEATTFLMTGEKLKFLLAILNSKVSEWYFNQIGTTTGMGTNR